MNISINFAKMAIGGAILLAIGAAFIANAAVTITSATINGDTSEVTVEPEAPVTIDVAGSKSPASGCDNNWGSTRVTVTGDSYLEVYESTNDSYTGSSDSDSVVFTAPAVDGDYEVLVELIRGVEPSLSCPDEDQPWESTANFDLHVVTPIDPYIEVLSISPIDEERIVGDTNPVTYVAEVEVGGTPDSATLQCVIFDLFQGDGWQTVDVNLGAGTHEVELDFDISTLAVGDYDVVVIASEETCADSTDGDFTTDDYRANGNTQYDAETVLHIVEDEVPPACRMNEVFGNVWGDTNQNDELSEGESYVAEGWEVKISNGETTETTTTDAEGGYSFCVGDGTWTITQTSPEGWTHSYPDDGEWVITFDTPVLSFLDQVINFFVPTALAAVAPNNGPLNFGVFQIPTYSQGSYGGGGNGTRIELRDNDDSSTDDEDEDEEPEGEVLGESTSVVPVGAPATGAGGASPLSLDLNILTAILATRERKEEAA